MHFGFDLQKNVKPNSLGISKLSIQKKDVLFISLILKENRMVLNIFLP